MKSINLGAEAANPALMLAFFTALQASLDLVTKNLMKPFSIQLTNMLDELVHIPKLKSTVHSHIKQANTALHQIKLECENI